MADFEITPLSKFSLGEGENVNKTLDITGPLNSNTIATVTMVIKNNLGVVVTTDYGLGTSHASGIITFGIKGDAAGTGFTILFTVVCNENAPDGSTAITYKFELGFDVTDTDYVLTAATAEEIYSYALTTLNHTKITLGISLSTHTDDALLIHLINNVTTHIETYCSRRFASTVYTSERYDGNSCDKIFLRQYPIISVSALTLNNQTVSEATDYDDYDGYWIEPVVKGIKLTGCLYRVDKWDIGWQNIKISYTAGFATIPSDLDMACQLVIRSLYNLYINSGGKKSESIGKYSYTYEDLSPAVREEISKVLNNYIPMNYY